MFVVYTVFRENSHIFPYIFSKCSRIPVSTIFGRLLRNKCVTISSSVTTRPDRILPVEADVIIQYVRDCRGFQKTRRQTVL